MFYKSFTSIRFLILFSFAKIGIYFNFVNIIG